MSQSNARVGPFVAVALALLAVVLVVRGCFSGPVQPRTVPVSGSIRYRGNPVADADVAFITPGNSRYAIGVTDDQGRFTLGTFMPGDGALVGTHRVTVTKLRGLAAPRPEGFPKTREEFEVQLKREQAYEAAAKAGHVGIPSRYAREHTTPLQVTIGPKGGAFDLELTDE